MSCLTFHDFKNGMVVMDGKRRVAKGHPTPHGWILRADAGCWIDIRARTQGLMPGKYPELMVVKTRREARRILEGIVQ